jgi:hypothetical protein
MTQNGNVMLYLDKELVEKSIELGFNLSKTFENHLKHLMTQFSKGNLLNNFENTENKKIVVGLPGFEPESIEPKSTSLDQASRQPHDVRLHHGWLGCLRILFSERGIQNGQPICTGMPQSYLGFFGQLLHVGCRGCAEAEKRIGDRHY